MWSKIKSLIIFVLILGVLVALYVMFVKKPKTEENLVSVNSPVTSNDQTDNPETAKLGEDFLSLLFSLKSINLDSSVFSSPAFGSLKDSSIILVPDGTQGRPNPFAPIGTENTISATSAADFLTSMQSQSEPKDTSVTPQFPGMEVKPETQNAPAPAATPKKKTN